MRNIKKLKIKSCLLNSLIALIIVLGGCNDSGKYYSMYDSKKHDSERYGSRMFNSIELSKDGSYTISEWHYSHTDLRHYKYVNSGDWIQQGDTIIIDGSRFLHRHSTLVDIEKAVEWKKRLLVIVKKE